MSAGRLGGGVPVTGGVGLLAHELRNLRHTDTRGPLGLGLQLARLAPSLPLGGLQAAVLLHTLAQLLGADDRTNSGANQQKLLHGISFPRWI
jgi:hypothetical protein